MVSYLAPNFREELNNMLMLTKAREATDKVLIRIAKAFLRQSYPLSEEGTALKDDVKWVLESNDLVWLRGNLWRLPTVERPHGKLFAELDFGSLGAAEVMGHKLITIQSHLGCTHQCEGFCDSCAPRKITRTMPFAAILKLAKEKHCRDRRFARIMLNFLDNLKRHRVMPEGEMEGGIMNMGLLPRDERELDARIQEMKGYEFIKFIRAVDDVCELHPIASIFRQWPMPSMTDAKSKLQHVWRYYWHYVPVMARSMMQPIHNFNGNDPIEYRNLDFLHMDGTPANFGDVFHYLTTMIRPIFLSTAGWLPSNLVAERAARRMMEVYRNDKWYSGGVRLTVKRYEILARTDPTAYVENLKRMITLFWPMVPDDFDVEIYYDPKIAGDIAWAESICDQLEHFAQSDLGGSLGIDTLVEVSHKLGRAYDPRYAETDHDSTGDAWGYHILPDGRVHWREEAVFKEFHDEKSGTPFYKLQSPSRTHKPTGVKLW